MAVLPVLWVPIAILCPVTHCPLTPLNSLDSIGQAQVSLWFIAAAATPVVIVTVLVEAASSLCCVV